MKFTGRLEPPVLNFFNKHFTAIIEINEQNYGEAYEELKGKFLSIELKEYRKRRSLDANAYYWVLIGKLAKVMERSTDEVHNMMLAKYGQREVYDGQLVYIVIPDTEEASEKAIKATGYHIAMTDEVKEGTDHKMYRTYHLLRGSSTYDTSEMARLIKGVQDECREIGIPEAEIATPDEKALLKEKFGIEL